MRRAALILAGVLATACAPEATFERPVVILETTQGPIEIQVYTDTAPISAADFLTYVDEGYYDEQGFYRVVHADNDPLKMGMSLIQGGRLDTEPLTSPIIHELTTETGLSNTTGIVSIARGKPGTGSAAYFFINIGDNDFLDTGGTRNPDGQGYASFGRVIKGMDVVRAIQTKPTKTDADNEVMQGQILANPVIITSAKRKR